MKPTPPERTDQQLLEANRHFYDRLWSEARLVQPDRFNTWPLVSTLAGSAKRRLEVAPGLRPRLPIAGTCFADISLPAIRSLCAQGGHAVLGQVAALPFADAAFDLLCALDVIEHVDDDQAAFAELARVAAPGAMLLLAVPLHQANWTEFDEFVGHRRRYEPALLVDLLAQHGFAIERSAIYGMQPRATWLLDLGIWFLVHQRERAMWWYNHLGMPLALRFERPLQMHAGLISTSGINTALLLCRKTVQPLPLS
jgi:SAM-dependent methyltransferase